MRLKIVLKGVMNRAFPRDHYHHLTGTVYDMIRRSDPDYSKWLHDDGFKTGNKKFKFFNFSKLLPEPGQYIYAGDRKEILIVRSDTATLYISSPVGEFLKNIVDFLLTNPQIRIADHILEIERATALSDPEFGEAATFKTLTPIILTKRVEGYDTPFYIRAYQTPEEFDEYLTKNAVWKWETFTEEEAPDICLTVDRDYLQKKGMASSCKIYYSRDQVLIGSNVPVKIKAPQEVIHFLYNVGLGEKNSTGLGMVEKTGYRY